MVKASVWEKMAWKVMASPIWRIKMHATWILEQGHATCSGELYFLLESPAGMMLGPALAT